MAQTPTDALHFSSALLVRPVIGAPMSAAQIETRTAKLASGEFRTDVRESEIYRDASGRMRIETKIRGPLGELFVLVEIVDPVEGFMAMLEAPARIAYRLRAPKADPYSLGFGSVTDAGVPRPGQDRTTEKLGRRVIEGIDFEGTRTTVTSDDRPPQIAVDERWISTKLGLTGSVESSDANQTYSAKIQRANRIEPDPALFSIPAGYTIRELQ